MAATWLDHIPLWALFLITAGALLLAHELGVRLARYHRPSLVEEGTSTQVGGIMGAILGLLAFLLAFTFGIAGGRFTERKHLVVDEANAIGTAFLRAQMLPDPHSAATRALLRQYVDVRLEAVHSDDAEGLQRAIDRSEEIQGQLWAHAVDLARKNPTSVVLGLYVRSLNDVIDLHAKRIASGTRDRIATSVWYALYFVAITGLALMGYQAGLTSARTTVASAALILAFSAVLLLTIDLDRPQQGLFKVGQQSMTDLQRSMSRPTP